MPQKICNFYKLISLPENCLASLFWDHPLHLTSLKTSWNVWTSRTLSAAPRTVPCLVKTPLIRPLQLPHKPLFSMHSVHNPPRVRRASANPATDLACHLCDAPNSPGAMQRFIRDQQTQFASQVSVVSHLRQWCNIFLAGPYLFAWPLIQRNLTLIFVVLLFFVVSLRSFWQLTTFVIGFRFTNRPKVQSYDWT